MEGDVPEWEKSKENVQPRKEGRNVGKLSVGLTARTETDSFVKIKSEQEKYELAIRAYDGEDPLSIWHEYIRWTEENFPIGGKGSQLMTLLTAFIKQFVNDDKSKNDRRFIKHCITYAGLYKEPVEVYRLLNSKRIGIKTADFYIAWASALEELGDQKGADKILTQGIEHSAQPLDQITKFKEELQTRICRSVMEKMSTETDVTERSPRRQALSGLASTSKGKVSDDRVSAARPNMKVVCPSSKDSKQPQVSLKVYNDENAPETFPAATGHYQTLPDAKENTQAAGKWSEQSLKSRQSSFNHPVVPTFEVLTDKQEQQLCTPSKPVTLGPHSGLSVKKIDKQEQEEDPVHILQAPNNLQAPANNLQEVPVYNKYKVCGVSEFSFEELRAIKWKQDQEKKRQEKEAYDRDVQQRQLLCQHAEQLAGEKQLLLERLIEEKLTNMRTDMEKAFKLWVSEAESNWKALEQHVLGLELKIEQIEEELCVIKANNLTLSHPPNDLTKISDDGGTKKTPSRAGNESYKMLSSKRHRTPDTSSAKRSFVKQSPHGVTQDCVQLMNGFFNRTIYYPAPNINPISRKESEVAPASTSLSMPSLSKEEPASTSPIVSFKPDEAPMGAAPAASCQFLVYTDGEESSSKPLNISEQASTRKTSAFQSNHKSSAQNSSGPFSVYGNLPHAPPPAAGFTIFCDENEYPIKNGAKLMESTDQGMKHKSRHVGADPLDFNTEFTLMSNFPAVAPNMSTPFHPQVNDCNPGIINGFLKRNGGIAENQPTQILSPITETYERSSSTVSSTGISGSINLTRTRSTSSSDPELLITGCDSHVETTHTKSRLYLSTGHVLGAVVETAEVSSQQMDDVGESTQPLLPKATPVIDTTHYAAPELTQAALNTTVFVDTANPFQEQLHAKLLRKIDLKKYQDVEFCEEEMPKLKVGTKVNFDGLILKIVSRIGSGGFATVYKAVVFENRTCRNESSIINLTQTNEDGEVCLKTQASGGEWEFYICRELKDRLSMIDETMDRDVLTRVMNVTFAMFYSNGSIMVNDLVPYGSLLNLVNARKGCGKPLPECFVMYIAIELLHTVELINRCKVIHGDIKPDNILFLGFPTFDPVMPFSTSSIKLIDFGRAIDMSKFPNGTTFTASNETDKFICIEMKTGQPWTYQTDLFGILGSLFTLLFLKYMVVEYKNNRWCTQLTRRFSRSRELKSSLWEELFDEFLNIPSCDNIPDISRWRTRFEEEFLTKGYVSHYKSLFKEMNHEVGVTRPLRQPDFTQ